MKDYSGELAQLVECCDRTAEVRGSIPLFSISCTFNHKDSSTFLIMHSTTSIHLILLYKLKLYVTLLIVYCQLVQVLPLINNWLVEFSGRQ